MSRLAVLALASMFVGACAGDPLPLSRAADDPSNPNAQEAAIGDAALLLRAPSAGTATVPSSPSSSHANHVHQASTPDAGVASADTIYTCPMHPEIRSDAPGHCPKCGMTLIPKKP